MLGNFSYYNPTKLYFGDESLNFLKDELKNYGPVVLLNYGSGSVKRNGIYDLGAEHPHRTGQEGGLDGTHDRSQRRRLDARPSWLCFGLRIDGVLSPCDGKRPA